MENYTGIIIENKKAKIKALTKPTKKMQKHRESTTEVFWKKNKTKK